MCALAIASCYRIFEVSLPAKVAPGQTFSGILIVTDNPDSDSDNNALTRPVFGVLLPDGWTVTMPENGFQALCENPDAEVKEGGVTTNCNASCEMLYSEQYTAILNDFYKRDGYTWHGFAAPKRLAIGLNGAAQGESDYIVANFTITAGTEVGKYEIEFVCGDEEDGNEGLGKYFNAVGKLDASKNNYRDSRLRQASTIDDEVFSQVNLDLCTIVEVTAEAGIKEINADNYSLEAIGNGQISIKLNGAALANTIANVYDMNGRLIASRVLGAENIIDAIQGLCVVTLVNGDKITTHKVVVK